MYRNRGVPSHLLGSGHFEDNSSDNSTDSKQQIENGGGDESIDYVSDAGNNNAFEVGIDAIDGNVDNNDDDNDDEQGDGHDSNVISKPEHKQDILPPPPGEPRPENTARIRRYRLNLE